MHEEDVCHSVYSKHKEEENPFLISNSISDIYSQFDDWQKDIVSSYLESGRPTEEEGVEEAFELLHETNERVRTGIWVGDCFIYNNSSWRLNYFVGGEVIFLYNIGALASANIDVFLLKIKIYTI